MHGVVRRGGHALLVAESVDLDGVHALLIEPCLGRLHALMHLAQLRLQVAHCRLTLHGFLAERATRRLLLRGPQASNLPRGTSRGGEEGGARCHVAPRKHGEEGEGHGLGSRRLVAGACADLDLGRLQLL